MDSLMNDLCSKFNLVKWRVWYVYILPLPELLPELVPELVPELLPELVPEEVLLLVLLDFLLLLFELLLPLLLPLASPTSATSTSRSTSTSARIRNTGGLSVFLRRLLVLYILEFRKELIVVVSRRGGNK